MRKFALKMLWRTAGRAGDMPSQSCIVREVKEEPVHARPAAAGPLASHFSPLTSHLSPLTLTLSPRP